MPIDAAACLLSDGKAPLPSSHLLGDTEALTSTTTLAPWVIPALLLDRDPFLLFKLRGMTRAGLIEMLQDVQVEDDAPQAEAHAQKSGSASSAREPLPVDCGAFWGQGAQEDLALGEVSVPAVKASLVYRLGAFPFWRGQEEFLPALEALYEAASKRGLAAPVARQPTIKRQGSKLQQCERLFQTRHKLKKPHHIEFIKFKLLCCMIKIIFVLNIMEHMYPCQHFSYRDAFRIFPGING